MSVCVSGGRREKERERRHANRMADRNTYIRFKYQGRQNIIYSPTVIILTFIFYFRIVVLSCVLMMHYRLRQEHAALEKDKIQGGSLRRMWSKFSGGGGGGSHRYRYEFDFLGILIYYLCIYI